MKSFLLLFSLILLISANGAGVFAQDNEPNNSASAAGSVNLGLNVNGAISENDAEDWYKISIPEEGTLKAETSSSDIKWYYIELYDVNSTSKLTYASTSSVNDTASISKTNLQAGVYYIRIVKHAWNYFGAYKFKATFTPALYPNDKEPNDSVDIATTIKLDTSYTGRLNYVYNNVGDIQDWYKINIPEEGALEVKTSSPDINWYYIQLYDVDSTSRFTYASTSHINDTASVLKTNLQAGNYFIRIVKHDWNYHGSYTIKATFTPAAYANDKEPNDSVEIATTIKTDTSYTGRLNYVYDKMNDIQDWYKINIPEEGALEVKTSSPDINWYYIQMYDVDSTSRLTYAGTNSINDTVSVLKTNLQAGNYFIRIVRHDWDYHGSYTFKATFTPAAYVNDREPNDSVKIATTIKADTCYTGRLNYVLDGKQDIEDWYKINIPEEGALEVKTSSPDINWYYIQMYDVDSTSRLTYAGTNSINDTVSVLKTNLQAGNYFIRIVKHDWNYHGSYTFEASFTPASYTNDKEPNDSVEIATTIKLDTSYTGRLNYVLNGKGDIEDWYKINIPGNGSLTTYTSSPDIRWYYIEIYDMDSTSRLTYVGTSSVNDTVSMKKIQLQAGDYFIRVVKHDWNYHGSYTFKATYKPAPIASFTWNTHFRNILFSNTSEYAETNLWNFGDGQTSNEVNPNHYYSQPGAYMVTLTTSNENGEYTDTSYVELRGIQKIEGTRGGNAGVVTTTIYAGGIEENSIPVLKLGDTEIIGENIKFPQTGQIQASFNLDNVTLGDYDVVIRNAGQPDMELPNAYLVEEAKQPDIWIDISGRNRALINRWQSYSVSIGNSGNIDAGQQILWLAVPHQVEFKNIEFVNPTGANFQHPDLLDSLHLINDYFELDRLDGAPFNGRLYGIMIHTVPASEKISIDFRVKSSEHFEVSAFVTDSWYMDNTLKTASYNECVGWAIFTFMRDKLTGLLAGQVPGADCLYNLAKTASEMHLSYHEGKMGFVSVSKALSAAAWTCVKDLGKNLPILKAMGLMKDVVDIILDIDQLYAAEVECQKYKKKNSVDSKKKHISAVTSFDPNEIVGPVGYANVNYIDQPVLPYTIYFENKDTASANAVEVFVRDTIDTNVFDMETFDFDYLGIGEQIYNVVAQNDSFALDIDLRPEINVIVRCIGGINRENGVACWSFHSFDPLTMDITEDPDAGFLPPNITKPEGEGFVSYSVAIKETVEHNDIVSAQAKIVFDFNEPIFTNTYLNTFDFETPQSHVYPLNTTIDSRFTVEWTGSDQGSGIAGYDIYVQEDDSLYLWLSNTPETLAEFEGKVGSSYSFYSIATDSVGHVEATPDLFDATTQITVGIDALNQIEQELRVYPNPVNDFINLSISNPPCGDYIIEMISINGVKKHSRIYTDFDIKNGIKINAIDYNPGHYLLNVRYCDKIINRKVMVK